MFSRTPVLTENREENLENAKFEVKVGKGAGKMVNLRSLRRLTYFTVWKLDFRDYKSRLPFLKNSFFATINQDHPTSPVVGVGRGHWLHPTPFHHIEQPPPILPRYAGSTDLDDLRNPWPRMFL